LIKIDGNITLRKLERSDLSNHTFPLSKEKATQRFTNEYILHWYFQKVLYSFSFWIALQEGILKGYATTSNFRFLLKGKEVKAAVPQNVYVVEELRGKGVFGKLYRETESENIQELKTDFFLSFTNKFSTDIFLQKFGYLKAQCPDLLLSFFNPLLFFKTPNYRKLQNFGEVNFSGIHCFHNGFIKDEQYYRWRYKKYKSEHLQILEVEVKTIPVGYAILVETKKRGIKFLVLADIICYKPSDCIVIFKEVQRYAARSLSIFLLAYKLDAMQPRGLFCFPIKNRFNLLVKGKTVDETIDLSKLQYNLCMGDMDFI
jgi:hypothetical protein